MPLRVRSWLICSNACCSRSRLRGCSLLCCSTIRGRICRDGSCCAGCIGVNWYDWSCGCILLLDWRDKQFGHSFNAANSPEQCHLRSCQRDLRHRRVDACSYGIVHFCLLTILHPLLEVRLTECFELTNEVRMRRQWIPARRVWNSSIVRCILSIRSRIYWRSIRRRRLLTGRRRPM